MAKKIGATVPLTTEDIREAITLWVKREYHLTVKPEAVQFDYDDNHEGTIFLNGAHIDFHPEEFKAILKD